MGLISFHGVKSMQALIAEFGKKKVQGGPLDGKLYETINLDKLKKAVRRYPSDSDFRKYARAYLALHELNPEAEPLPCAPLLVDQAGAPKVGDQCKPKLNRVWALFGHGFRSLVKTRVGICMLVLSLLALLLRPSVTTVLARTVVTTARLFFRRFMQLLSMICEGVMDEMVYQLENAVTDFLPEKPAPGTVKVSFNLAAHLISGLIGAASTVLCGHRRPPQA